jgi:hypothetical protein
MKKMGKHQPMTDLVDTQFDCLDAISDMGALCPALDEKSQPTGMFRAIASPKVNDHHPGWSTGVINALYLRKLLAKNPSGEYTITIRGKTACVEHKAKRDRQAVISAARANPEKIVLLCEVRKGV